MNRPLFYKIIHNRVPDVARLLNIRLAEAFSKIQYDEFTEKEKKLIQKKYNLSDHEMCIIFLLD